MQSWLSLAYIINCKNALLAVIRFLALSKAANFFAFLLLTVSYRFPL